MKISKLFHWLYASVMLMPLFAIGFKCLYVTFNPNAKDSYYGETINEEQTKQIQYNNLTINSSYIFDNEIVTPVEDERRISLLVSNVIDLSNEFDLSTVDRLYFFMYPNSNPTQAIVYLYTGNDLVKSYVLSARSMYISFTLNGYLQYENLTFLNNFNYFYQIEYNDYSYIDNVFYYSVEQIGNEPLFNWANNTFLSSPLLYITNLFGVPSTSPIITLLCFWFSVSIIWLVFDMLMYVPLLVHRWLDKGVLE